MGGGDYRGSLKEMEENRCASIIKAGEERKVTMQHRRCCGRSLFSSGGHRVARHVRDKTVTVYWATFLRLELSRVRVLIKGYILLSSNHQVHCTYYSKCFDNSHYKTEQILIKIIDLLSRSNVFLNLHFVP